MVLSFTPGEVVFEIPAEAGEVGGAQLLIGTYADEGKGVGGALEAGGRIMLEPYEGRVCLL